MSKNLSPALSRELANLDKDSETRKSAMKALKSYVKDLDSRAVPLFVARVSETKDAGNSSGEYTIPLYEDLARTQGPNIVSQIDIIMGTIIRILTTSGGSFPLQQACSKVAPTIARYAIVPTTPENEKSHIICMLSKPLSDSILGSNESLSCGAALCLNALVECDNWRFASDEMVNEVCLKIAGALKDKNTQTNSHMGLIVSLAKNNSLIVEAYAGLLIRSGLEILNIGASDKNSQKMLAAIQMISSLMKCLDIRSIYSDLELIVEEMDKCQSSEMPYVRAASFEAILIARKLITGKGLGSDPDVVSVTGSNGKSGLRCKLASGNQSPECFSPRSHTLESLDSCIDNNWLVDSPFSTTQASCNVDFNQKFARRNLRSYANGGVDISLEDGIFSEIMRGGAPSHASSEHFEATNSERGYANSFNGFYPGTPRGFRSQTSSPQRSRPQRSNGSMKIYRTPREHVQFSPNEEHENTVFYENQSTRFTSPCSVKCGCSPSKCNSNSNQNGAPYQQKINGNLTDKGQVSDSESESVSSTEGVQVANEQVTGEITRDSEENNKVVKKTGVKTGMKVFLCSILVLVFAVLVSEFCLDSKQEGLHLVPT